MNILITSLAITTYALLAGLLILRLRSPKSTATIATALWSKWLPFVPAALHLYSLYFAIETEHGQNLSLLNILSLVSLIMVLLVSIYRIKHQTPHLMLYSALFALTILALGFVPNNDKVLTLTEQPIALWHIWLSVIGFSLLCVAFIQASLVLLLNKQLRNKPASIHPLSPPLTQMERFLEDLVLAGILALSVALILGFLLPSESLQEQPLHKIVLTALAWFSFCTCYWGYKSSKLSSIRFARFCIMAFLLLALGFVGSKIVLEYIIQRG